MNAFAKAQIEGTMIEVLEMVKDDFPSVDVAQSKYGYSPGMNDRADRDLAWANPSRFSVVDALINHDGLVTLWELLQSTVDADEDYARLAAEKGWESRIDPTRMGLIQEPMVDPNIASSSKWVLSGPSRTRGCIIPPVVPAAGLPPPNVIARRRQPPEEALDVMDEDMVSPSDSRSALPQNQVINLSPKDPEGPK